MLQIKIALLVMNFKQSSCSAGLSNTGINSSATWVEIYKHILWYKQYESTLNIWYY